MGVGGGIVPRGKSRHSSVCYGRGREASRERARMPLHILQCKTVFHKKELLPSRDVTCAMVETPGDSLTHLFIYFYFYIFKDLFTYLFEREGDSRSSLNRKIASKHFLYM